MPRFFLDEYLSPRAQPAPFDEAAVVVGWRTWLVTDTAPGGRRLRALHDGTIWIPGEPLRADGSMPFAGGMGGGPGIYAHTNEARVLAATRGVFRRDLERSSIGVYGRVALWGNVRWNCAELVADCGYPLSIDGCHGEPADAASLLEELRREYLAHLPCVLPTAESASTVRR